MPYKAFISYSHTADDRFAPILQSALHRFAKPWNQMRAMRVFLDKGSLSATPKLWTTIQKALSESEFLLLLASPRATQSEWVPKEVQQWIELGRADKLLVALTDGEIAWDGNRKDFDWNATTALPRTLAGVLSEPPLYVDLRWAKAEEDLSLNHPRFRDKIADLSSTLQGIPKDALIGEDVRQHRKGVLARRAAVTALVLLCIAAGAAAFIAYQQRNEALRQTNIATARQLGAEAQLVRTREPELLPAAALVAVESMRRFPTTEADQLLRYAFDLLRPPVTVIHNKTLLNSYNNAIGARFTRDGSRLITITDDLARVWEVATGKELATLKHDELVREFALSHDEAYLATTIRNVIRIFENWDTPRAREINRISYEKDLRGIGFSRSGRYLVATEELGDFAVWTNWQSPDSRLVMTAKPEHEAWRATFSEDEQALVTMDESGGLQVWNLETGELRPGSSRKGAITEDREHLVVLEDKAVRIVKPPDGPEIGRVGNLDFDTDMSFDAVDFSETGKYYAMEGNGNVVVVRSLTDGRQVSTLRLQSTVEQVLFQPGGSLLATLSRPRTVQLWNVASATEVARFVPDEVPDRIAFSPDGTRLATLGRLKVHVWDVAGMSQPRMGSRLYSAAFAPDGPFVAVAGVDSTVRVFGVPSGAVTNELPKLPSDVYAVTISSSGRYLAAAGQDVADIYEPWHGTPKRLARVQRKDSFNALAFSDDERYLVTGGSDKLVVWTDWQSGEPRVKSQIEVSERVHGVAFSPDARYLATAGGDRLVRLWTGWNTSSPVEAGRLRHDPAEDRLIGVWAVAFSPDGRYLATSTSLPQTFVWADWSSSAPRQVARFDEALISPGRAFSPDSKYLTVRGGGSVRVLELETGRELVRAVVADEDTSRVSGFDPDGKFILADGKISFWRPDDMIREACRRLTFDIGLDDWRRIRQDAAAAGPCAAVGK